MTNILLIEDNLDCARMVRKLLTPLGYYVEHADHGLQGLQLARQTDPDLILVDINLPDISGNVVILQLRACARRATTPIVAFTAETGPKTRRVASAFGCDGFLCKPIDTREFPSQIEGFLNLEVSPHHSIRAATVINTPVHTGS